MTCIMEISLFQWHCYLQWCQLGLWSRIKVISSLHVWMCHHNSLVCNWYLLIEMLLVWFCLLWRRSRILGYGLVYDPFAILLLFLICLPVKIILIGVFRMCRKWYMYKGQLFKTDERIGIQDYFFSCYSGLDYTILRLVRPSVSRSPNSAWRKFFALVCVRVSERLWVYLVFR